MRVLHHHEPGVRRQDGAPGEPEGVIPVVCDDPARPPADMRKHAHGRGFRQGEDPGGEVRHALLAVFGAPIQTGKALLSHEWLYTPCYCPSPYGASPDLRNNNPVVCALFSHPPPNTSSPDMRLFRSLEQFHYDWGLRAVKSVLLVAGKLKRCDPHIDEEAVLMRALRDFNTPKIVSADTPIFLRLIADLFPSMDLAPKVSYFGCAAGFAPFPCAPRT